MPGFLLSTVPLARIQPDEDLIRSTIDPVPPPDWPVPEAETQPQSSEQLITDSNPLHGLTTRNVSGDVHPRERYPASWAVTYQGVNIDPAQMINSQQASAGYSPQLEAEVAQGHGTMEWTETLDPVITEATALGNDYFAVDREPIQALMVTDTMDTRFVGNGLNDMSAVAAMQATRNSRSAAQATLYSNFLASGV